MALREARKTGHTISNQHVTVTLNAGEKQVSMTIWGEAMTKRFEKLPGNRVRYRGCLLDPYRFHVDFSAEVEAAKKG